MKLRGLLIIACVACASTFTLRAAAQQPGAERDPGAPPLAADVAIATPPEITIQDTPAGPLFADRKGFTLYITDRDKDPGKSTCLGPCAEQWVPLRSEADTKPFGDWTLVARQDGKPQWAYKGRPMYRYRWEAKPRWAEAQNDSWRYATVVNFPLLGSTRRGYTPPPSDAKVVLPPTPGGVSGGPTKYGITFVDTKQITLYTQSVVAPCTGPCLETWVPLSAPQAASAIGDWTVVTRNDGSRQWAFQGRPVYRFVKDIKPGDAAGASDAWKPLVVPKPGAPSAQPAAKPASAPAPRGAATTSGQKATTK